MEVIGKMCSLITPCLLTLSAVLAISKSMVKVVDYYAKLEVKSLVVAGFLMLAAMCGIFLRVMV